MMARLCCTTVPYIHFALAKPNQKCTDQDVQKEMAVAENELWSELCDIK